MASIMDLLYSAPAESTGVTTQSVDELLEPINFPQFTQQPEWVIEPGENIFGSPLAGYPYPEGSRDWTDQEKYSWIFDDMTMKPESPLYQTAMGFAEGNLGFPSLVGAGRQGLGRVVTNLVRPVNYEHKLPIIWRDLKERIARDEVAKYESQLSNYSATQSVEDFESMLDTKLNSSWAKLVKAMEYIYKDKPIFHSSIDHTGFLRNPLYRAQFELGPQPLHKYSPEVTGTFGKKAESMYDDLYSTKKRIFDEFNKPGNIPPWDLRDTYSPMDFFKKTGDDTWKFSGIHPSVTQRVDTFPSKFGRTQGQTRKHQDISKSEPPIIDSKKKAFRRQNKHVASKDERIGWLDNIFSKDYVDHPRDISMGYYTRRFRPNLDKGEIDILYNDVWDFTLNNREMETMQRGFKELLTGSRTGTNYINKGETVGLATRYLMDKIIKPQTVEGKMTLKLKEAPNWMQDYIFYSKHVDPKLRKKMLKDMNLTEEQFPFRFHAAGPNFKGF